VRQVEIAQYVGKDLLVLVGNPRFPCDSVEAVSKEPADDEARVPDSRFLAILTQTRDQQSLQFLQIAARG
jgi:hypothetical protein